MSDTNNPLNDPSATEARQEFRLARQETVFIEQGGSDSETASLMVSTSLDMSANGLRIITDSPMLTGSIVRICVQFRERNERFLLVCEVKWCRDYDAGHDYLVGLSLFESEDTDIQQWKEMIARYCS